MTDAIQIVKTVLVADTGVIAIAGRSAFPIEFPEKAQPPVNVINAVGGHDEQMLSGPGGYWQNRIRVESLALTSDVAVNLGNAVRDALGGVVKQTVGAATDVDIYLESGSMTDKSDDRSMFRVIHDFTVRYRT